MATIVEDGTAGSPIDGAPGGGAGVNLGDIAITGGTIDGVDIGVAVRGLGLFTDVSASGSIENASLNATDDGTLTSVNNVLDDGTGNMTVANDINVGLGLFYVSTEAAGVFTGGGNTLDDGNGTLQTAGGFVASPEGGVYTENNVLDDSTGVMQVGSDLYVNGTIYGSLSGGGGGTPNEITDGDGGTAYLRAEGGIYGFISDASNNGNGFSVALDDGTELSLNAEDDGTIRFQSGGSGGGVLNVYGGYDNGNGTTGSGVYINLLMNPTFQGSSGTVFSLDMNPDTHALVATYIGMGEV